MKSLRNKQMTFDGTLRHYMKLILQAKFPQMHLFSSILMVYETNHSYCTFSVLDTSKMPRALWAMDKQFGRTEWIGCKLYQNQDDGKSLLALNTVRLKAQRLRRIWIECWMGDFTIFRLSTAICTASILPSQAGSSLNSVFQRKQIVCV
jgi:hypothetical protein